MVTDDAVDLAAQRFSFGDGRFETPGPATIAFANRPAGDVDVCALGSEFDCAAPAHAASGAGHDYGLAFEWSHRKRR